MSTRARALLVSSAALAAGYLAVAILFDVILDFRFFRSDVWYYWSDSERWYEPFNVFHVPAYPLVIAAGRAITGDAVKAVALMMAINLAALLAGAAAVFAAVSARGGDHRVAALAAIGFGFWPLVGLTYAVIPLADLPAMALIAGGLAVLVTGGALAGAALLGLAMITHKAAWVFASCILAAHFISSRPRPARAAAMTAVAFLPLVVLWAAGSAHFGDPFWIVRSSWNNGAETSTGLPLFDSVYAALASGGLRALIKGGMLAGVLTLAAAVLVAGRRMAGPAAAYGPAIAAAVIALLAFTTPQDGWAVARFSRLLVIPLGWLAIERGWNLRRWPTTAVVASAIASQAAMAYYISKVFFS